MEDAIVAENLTKRFGAHVAVDTLNLRVPRGRIFGYLGLNGAGKSTTIKMLTTLLRPSSGSAFVMGYDVEKEPMPVRNLIGLLGDEGGESRPQWTAREFVRYFAGLHDIEDPRGAAERALDVVELDPDWRQRPMASYSTGMRRRVELARAIVADPRILFLDEPTRGLDLPAKRQSWELFRRLAKDEGVTIFLSSHEVAEILALCDELAVIAKGKLTYEGSAAELGPDSEKFERNLIPLLEDRPREEQGPAPRRNLPIGRGGMAHAEPTSASPRPGSSRDR